MRALLAGNIVAGPRNFGFRLSDFGFAAHPRVEPQRHRATQSHRKHEGTKTRSHRNVPTDHADNADGGSPKSSAWRGPRRRRTTTGDRWNGSSLRTRAFVAVTRSSGLRSRRAQASPLLHLCWVDGATPPIQGKGEAEPTRPGRVVRGEAGQRRTLASGVDMLSPGTRRSSDRRSVPPSISALQFQ